MELIKETKVEYNTKVEALNYMGLTELPQEWKKNSSKIWVKAIVLVMKNNGKKCYCVADNKEGEGARIIKDFGKSYGIVNIEAIYPTMYLDANSMPDLRKQSDCVTFLKYHGEDEEDIKALLSKEGEDGQEKAADKLSADKQKVKKLIIKYAIKDCLNMDSEKQRLVNDYKEYKEDGKEGTEK